jgi:hypothetical protein
MWMRHWVTIIISMISIRYPFGLSGFIACSSQLCAELHATVPAIVVLTVPENPEGLRETTT